MAPTKIVQRIASAGAALAVGAAFTSASFAATNWQGYTYQPTTGVPQYDFLPRIAKNVAEATDNGLTIKVVPNGGLPIKGHDVASAVADGIVQFAGATSGTVSLVPIYGMSRFPMLFPTQDALAKGLDTILKPEIDETLAQKGIKDLCMWWYPPHTIWSVDKKIAGLDDLKGMKLRVTSPQQGEFVKQFGAIPVTISTAEVAPAIQQGVIDGALTSASGAVLWVDDFKYDYKLPLNFGTSFVLANKDAYDGLPADQRAALDEASKEGCDWVTKTLADQEAGLYSKYSEKGMVEITEPDQAAIKTALSKAKTIWTDEAASLGDAGTEMLKKIEAAQASD